MEQVERAEHMEHHAEQQDIGSQLEAYAEQLRQRLPAAPDGLIDGYVRFAPWIAMVFGLFGFFATFALFLVGTALSPLLLLGGADALHMGMASFVALAMGLIGSALDVTGGYLMLRRKMTGWWMMVAALLISAANGLLSLSLFGVLITLTLGYVHLQARPRYHY